MLNLVTGSVPRGADYFGRSELIATIRTRLKTDNVLIVAPRRFGKTGAMMRLLDEPAEGFVPLYIDVEHIESASDFMIEVLARLRRERRFAAFVNALWESAKGFGAFLHNLAEEVDVGSLKIKLRDQTDVVENWREYGDRIMQQLRRETPALLLLLDELPIMLHHIAQRNENELCAFLRWFRSVRIEPETRTRFVIGGSINLITSLDDVGLVDTVNDLSIIRLEPFNDRTAVEFIDQSLATHDMRLEKKARSEILRCLGTPIPYLLSVLLTALVDRCRLTGDPITETDVREVFESELLTGATPFFRHYYSRLREYYADPEARLAKVLLTFLSRTEGAVTRTTLFQKFLQAAGESAGDESAERFQRLMQKLENDFYVTVRDDSFEFSNRAIRLWWKNNYGFQMSEQ